MGAWGGVVKTDPDKLLHRYRVKERHVDMVSGIQSDASKNQQRIGAMERAMIGTTASAKDSKETTAAPKADKLEARVLKLVQNHRTLLLEVAALHAKESTEIGLSLVRDTEAVAQAVRMERDEIGACEALLDTRGVLLQDDADLDNLDAPDSAPRGAKLKEKEERVEAEIKRILSDLGEEDAPNDSAEVSTLTGKVLSLQKDVAAEKVGDETASRLKAFENEYKLSHDEVSKLTTHPESDQVAPPARFCPRLCPYMVIITSHLVSPPPVPDKVDVQQAVKDEELQKVDFRTDKLLKKATKQAAGMVNDQV